MIVDDEEINLQLIANTLQASYSVFTAKNAQNAIKSATSNTPDLILLDILMPEIDGFEICKELKNEPETADIPIIFLTSKDKDKDQIEAFELGAVDYIIKPFRPLIDIQRITVHIRLNKQNKLALNLMKPHSKNPTTERFFGLEQEIKELYNFTSTEANLCNGLVNGLTLGEIATSSGVTYNTLRSYLRSIFAKTNTKKQHELVATVMTSLLLCNEV